MALGNWLGKLFGGGDGGSKAEPSEPGEEYKGYSIVPTPIKEGGQYRVSGIIRREIDGEMRETSFIRADNSTDRNFCVTHALTKGRQIIDEQGNSLFDRPNV